MSTVSRFTSLGFKALGMLNKLISYLKRHVLNYNLEIFAFGLRTSLRFVRISCTYTTTLYLQHRCHRNYNSKEFYLCPGRCTFRALNMEEQTLFVSVFF